MTANFVSELLNMLAVIDAVSSRAVA